MRLGAIYIEKLALKVLHLSQCWVCCKCSVNIFESVNICMHCIGGPEVEKGKSVEKK